MKELTEDIVNRFKAGNPPGKIRSENGLEIYTDFRLIIGVLKDSLDLTALTQVGTMLAKRSGFLLLEPVEGEREDVYFIMYYRSQWAAYRIAGEDFSPESFGELYDFTRGALKGILPPEMIIAVLAQIDEIKEKVL